MIPNSEDRAGREPVVFGAQNYEETPYTRPRASTRAFDTFEILTFNEGTYQGEVDGYSRLPNGQGVYRYHNGDVYSGGFLANNRHGYGRMMYGGGTGQCYEGNFKYNVPSGAGRLEQGNGDLYVGNFRKGLYSGHGRLAYSNQNVYEGEFKAGKKHGLGRFQFGNGDVFEGLFQKEIPNGLGKMTFAESGYSEEGHFTNGKMGDLSVVGDPVSATGEAGDEDLSSSDEEREEDDGESVVSDSGALRGAQQIFEAADPKTKAVPGGKSIHFTGAKSNSDFKEKGYWDSRFQEEEEYDWLLTFEQFKGSLLRYFPKLDDSTTSSPGSEKIAHTGCGKTRILVVGCGNSSFSADLYDSGYWNIVNIDYSQVVIDKMQAKYADRPGMSWICMDMTRLEFEEGTEFDVVVDKAAMDALMVDEGDVWNPRPTVCAAAHSMCQEMRRVLSKSGLFLQISFMQPHFRTKYLMGLRRPGQDQSSLDHFSSLSGRCESYDWTLSVETIDVESGCLSTFLYVLLAPEWKDPQIVERKLTRKERLEFEKKQSSKSGLDEKR